MQVYKLEESEEEITVLAIVGSLEEATGVRAVKSSKSRKGE